MKKRERIEAVFLYGIFISYIFLLIKILFLSRVSFQELFQTQRTLFGSINLIPFHSIMEYISASSDTVKRFAFGNVIGNIVVFIPLGIYVPLFKKDRRAVVNLLLIFLMSLCIEILQGLLGVGVSDIDDIILNSFGGWIGILGYRALLFLLQKEKRVRTTVTILSVIIGLPFMLYLLFMVKMRF